MNIEIVLFFIIIAIPSRESVHEYKRLNKSVALSIGRINGQYSSLENIPIHYINRSLPFPELCALYTLAEVCTVTPLIDGMNLVAKEYIACQVESPGVLILSEFAGAAQELGLTITVNPFDIVDVADSIHRALNMKESEKLDILSVLRERIIKYNSSYWAKNFIEELNMVNYRLMKSERYKTANQELIKQFIDSPKKKGIFLDYDGTLVDFKKDAQKAIPDAELKIILANLSQKIEIDFFIISGRNGEFLEKHFSNYSFHLIAEHGFLYKTKNSQWKVLIDSVDLSWKEEGGKGFRSLCFSYSWKLC